MRRALQVEAERDQAMADGVVQLAGDAQPLGEAAAVGEEIPRRPQLCVRPPLAVERLDGEEGEELEAEVGRGEQKGGAERPVDGDRRRQQQRLDGDPQEPRAAGSPRRELHGDHHQEGPLEAVAELEHQGQHADRLHGEEGKVDAPAPFACRRW